MNEGFEYKNGVLCFGGMGIMAEWNGHCSYAESDQRRLRANFANGLSLSIIWGKNLYSSGSLENPSTVEVAILKEGGICRRPKDEDGYEDQHVYGYIDPEEMVKLVAKTASLSAVKSNPSYSLNLELV